MISFIETGRIHRSSSRLASTHGRVRWNTRTEVASESTKPTCVQNRQHHSNIFSLAGVLIRALINACYGALVSPFSMTSSPSLSSRFLHLSFPPCLPFPSCISSRSLQSAAFFLRTFPVCSFLPVHSPRDFQRAIRINIYIVIASMLYANATTPATVLQSPLYFP